MSTKERAQFCQEFSEERFALCEAADLLQRHIDIDRALVNHYRCPAKSSRIARKLHVRLSGLQGRELIVQSVVIGEVPCGYLTFVQRCLSCW